jgi:hypothetical protein
VSITIPVIDAFVNINRACKGAKESGVNAGTFVTWVQQQTGNANGDPWCASLQAKVGFALLRDKWPVPLTAACKAVGDWATKQGCLKTEPQVGSLMLFWGEKDSRGARFNHIGCVIKVIDSNTVVTIEGNTSEGPGLIREGAGCFERTRNIGPRDRFVFWWEALK